MEELISRVFALRDATHLAHWATKSFAQHLALGELYDGLVDKIDGLVEAYQGTFGLIGDVKIVFMPKENIVGSIREELDWIKSNRDRVAKGSTMLENLLDDLMQLYSTALYKLVNLK